MRFLGRLTINRAIATRYDQLAKSFLSMVHIAAGRYWLKFVHSAQANQPGSIVTASRERLCPGKVILGGQTVDRFLKLRHLCDQQRSHTPQVCQRQGINRV
jgi:hypothetical protein